jgi:hypothetical protein
LRRRCRRFHLELGVTRLDFLFISRFQSTLSMAASNTFGMDAKQLGYLQTFSAVSGLVANVFLVGLVEKLLTQTDVVTAAVAIITGGMVLYTQATTAAHVTAVVALLAVPSTALYTTITSMLTKAASKQNTATVIGLGHAARSAVGMIAPTVGGYVLAGYGTQGVGASCAGVLGGALLFLQLFKSSLGSMREPEAGASAGGQRKSERLQSMERSPRSKSPGPRNDTKKDL